MPHRSLLNRDRSLSSAAGGTAEKPPWGKLHTHLFVQRIQDANWPEIFVEPLKPWSAQFPEIGATAKTDREDVSGIRSLNTHTITVS